MLKSYYQNFNYSSNRIFSLVQIQSKDKHSLEQYLDWETETKFYFYCSLSKNNPECELGPWPTRAQHASMHQDTIWAWAAKAFAHLGLFPVWLPSAIGSDLTVARHFRSNKKNGWPSGTLAFLIFSLSLLSRSIGHVRLERRPKQRCHSPGLLPARASTRGVAASTTALTLAHDDGRRRATPSHAHLRSDDLYPTSTYPHRTAGGSTPPASSPPMRR
jgi:hypothetical protein